MLNRLTDIQARSYTYNNGNELLLKNGTSFTYDANGNMISKTDSSGITSYVYDSENRLVQINTQPVTGNPQLVAYKYDPFGRRIEKNVNGIITRYVYDREDILFELDGNNNIITEYLHGPGIDEPIAMIRGGQTYYYHADALGSIVAITDTSGNVVQKYEYDSFGNISYQLDSNFKQPYTYTGREYDEESGLYYYRARYYSPKLQRFISEDPIKFKGGINFYRYVGNNPANRIDPLGLDDLSDLEPDGTIDSYPDDYLGGIGDFIESYGDMMDATYWTGGSHHGWAGQDAYFHCRANCEAAQRGQGGEDAARCISDAREWFDQAMGDPPSASSADQAANQYGRSQGAANPTGDCRQLCSIYRPGGSFPF